MRKPSKRCFLLTRGTRRLCALRPVHYVLSVSGGKHGGVHVLFSLPRLLNQLTWTGCKWRLLLVAANAGGRARGHADRMVVGAHLTFKALVGTASLEADARAAGTSTPSGDEQEDWFAASRRPAPTEATGASPAVYGRRGLALPYDLRAQQQRVNTHVASVAVAASVVGCKASSHT